MKFRAYQPEDIAAITRMHADSGLNPACMPDLLNPNFVVRLVADEHGKPIQAGFVKLIGEGYILVDHSYGSAQERWRILGDLTARALSDAARYGLDQVSCWIPPTEETAFGKRIESLGFIPSRWKCWTANLL